MTKQEAIEGSIAHWKRMIKWVEELPENRKKDDPWSEDDMEDDIGESWTEEHCDLCKKYVIQNRKAACKGCPLAEKYGRCEYESTKNAWMKVSSSVTWRGWLHHARRMLKQLESLRGES